LFDRLDANKDSVLSADEMEALGTLRGTTQNNDSK